MKTDVRTLEDIAKNIPSMGGYKIREVLRELAKNVESGSSIVEVGSWLGSGTAQICLGVLDSNKETKLYIYDYFVATKSQIPKAASFGVKLVPGHDYLGLVKSYLDPFGVNIAYNKGDSRSFSYSGESIGLYVDDASKNGSKFEHAMKTFSPFFIKNKTHLVLMDYFYYEKTGKDAHEFQSEYMKKNNKFVFVNRISKDGSEAVFLYVG